MAYTSARDLKTDILFRTGESGSGNSPWDAQVMNYLNRAYRTLADGSSEYLPDYVHDWWWMRAQNALILEPAYESFSINVTQNNNVATFVAPLPSFSLAGWMLKVRGSPETYEIVTHDIGGGSVNLDQIYVGDTLTGSGCTVMRTIYTLSAAVASLVGPMIVYRNWQRQIGHQSPERMDELYPLADLAPGFPEAFSLEDESTVRFSHGGMTDGHKMRVDYRYKPVIDDLTDSDSSIPLVPLRYRHILSDMAMVFIAIDKSDTRAQTYISAANSVLKAMYKENRHRMAKIGKDAGHIYPRQRMVKFKGPLRTESGLIIG